MKARVFLSYARIDGGDACDFFYRALNNAGYSVFRDITELTGGALWRQKIEETIRAADVVLLFLTQGAIDSPNVQDEWKTAIRFHKRVVPLILKPVTVPPELQQFNCRDVQNPEVYGLEPSKVQKDLEAEHDDLVQEFDRLRSNVVTLIADDTLRKYLEPFTESLNRRLVAEPSVLPSEVMRMMFSLLSKLTDALSAGDDITSLVESMATGTYSAAGWKEEEIYKLRVADAALILKGVRDAIPTIPVRVVVVAMTRDEAEDLKSGNAFSGLPPEWQQNFDSILPTLAADWLEWYHKTSEEWEPFAGEECIKNLIQDELQSLSNKLRMPLRYTYVEIRDLAQPALRQKLLDLRKGGCLVVLDAISAWHPLLHAAFRATNLDVSPTSIVVRVAPDVKIDDVLKKVGFLLREWLKCEFFQRAKLDKDLMCDTIRDLDNFQKWIYTRLESAAPAVAAQRNDIRQHINNFSTADR